MFYFLAICFVKVSMVSSAAGKINQYYCPHNGWNKCMKSCSGDGCTLNCNPGNYVCTLECDGLNCTQYCNSEICDMKCSGQVCNQRCSSGKKCKMVCSGNYCNQICNTGKECEIVCSGRYCNQITSSMAIGESSTVHVAPTKTASIVHPSEFQVSSIEATSIQSYGKWLRSFLFLVKQWFGRQHLLYKEWNIVSNF